jgi:hypothetical protein
MPLMPSVRATAASKSVPSVASSSFRVGRAALRSNYDAYHHAGDNQQQAAHYRNPYPRPMNVAPGIVARVGSKPKKAQDRLRQQSKPIYLHSFPV